MVVSAMFAALCSFLPDVFSSAELNAINVRRIDHHLRIANIDLDNVDDLDNYHRRVHWYEYRVQEFTQ